MTEWCLHEMMGENGCGICQADEAALVEFTVLLSAKAPTGAETVTVIFSEVQSAK